MKVYSWYKLFETVLIGVACIAFCVADIMSGDGLDLGWMVLTVVAVGKGFYTALSKQSYEKYKKEQIEQKRICRKLFDKWAPIMPWISEILFLMALVCFILIPAWKWTALLLYVTGLFYEIWLTSVVGKHEVLEDKREQ